MYITKRRGCGLFVFANFSFICWIIFAFIDIRTWIAGITAIAMMMIFDRGCVREYGKTFFGFNYLIGVIVSVMIGFGIGISAAPVIISALTMPVMYTMALEMYLFYKEHENDYDYDDDE